MRRVAAIVREHVVLEPLERDALQVARWDDAVGVDVVTAQRQRTARDGLDSMRPPLTRHSLPRPVAGRTSTTSPASAAAATMAGDISSVRPVGLP